MRSPPHLRHRGGYRGQLYLYYCHHHFHRWRRHARQAGASNTQDRLARTASELPEPEQEYLMRRELVSEYPAPRQPAQPGPTVLPADNNNRRSKRRSPN